MYSNRKKRKFTAINIIQLETSITNAVTSGYWLCICYDLFVSRASGTAGRLEDEAAAGGVGAVCVSESEWLPPSPPDCSSARAGGEHRNGVRNASTMRRACART